MSDGDVHLSGKSYTSYAGSQGEELLCRTMVIRYARHLSSQVAQYSSDML